MGYQSVWVVNPLTLGIILGYLGPKRVRHTLFPLSYEFSRYTVQLNKSCVLVAEPRGMAIQRSDSGTSISEFKIKVLIFPIQSLSSPETRALCSHHLHDVQISFILLP